MTFAKAIHTVVFYFGVHYILRYSSGWLPSTSKEPSGKREKHTCEVLYTISFSHDWLHENAIYTCHNSITLWGLTNCAYVRLGLRVCLHVPDSACYSPTEANTNWPLFCRRYFNIHFPEWEVLYFDDSFAEICFQGPPKNSIPLSEPLLA